MKKYTIISEDRLKELEAKSNAYDYAKEDIKKRLEIRIAEINKYSNIMSNFLKGESYSLCGGAAHNAEENAIEASCFRSVLNYLFQL